MDNNTFVDKCIDDCGGGNSRFHKIFLTLLGLLFGSPCLFVYGFGFFELVPKLKCQSSVDSLFSDCTQIEACQVKKYSINYDDENTISNWITSFDLICLPKSEIGLFGGLMLAGFFFGSIFLVRLGDIVGRKLVVFYTTLAVIVSLFTMAITSNIIVLFACIFIFGLSYIPRAIVVYIWALELTTKKYETIYSSLNLALDSVCLIILGLYFYTFKTMNPILYFLCVLQIIVIVFVMLHVPESPKYLYEKGEYQQFVASLEKIAKFNNKQINSQEFRNLETNQNQENNEQNAINEENRESMSSTRDEIHEEQEKLTMKRIFKNRVYLFNAIALAFAWGTSAYSFYLIEFYMKYAPVKSIYGLAMLMGCSDVITCFIFAVIIRYLSSKKILSLSFFLLSVTSLVLAISIWSITEVTTGVSWFYTLLIFGMRFSSALAFNTSYYANNEYFPALLKGGIFAVTNVAARSASILSPLVSEWMSNPSITVAIVGAISFLSTFLLKKEEITTSKGISQ